MYSRGQSVPRNPQFFIGFKNAIIWIFLALNKKNLQRVRPACGGLQGRSHDGGEVWLAKFSAENYG